MHNFPQAFMTVRVPAIQRIREKDVQLLLELPEALKRRQPAETHLTAWSRCLTNELNRWNLCVMFDVLKQTWRLTALHFECAFGTCSYLKLFQTRTETSHK